MPNNNRDNDNGTRAASIVGLRMFEFGMLAAVYMVAAGLGADPEKCLLFYLLGRLLVFVSDISYNTSN
jgi:hypothetical protein